MNCNFRKTDINLKKFHANISRYQLYPEDSKVVQDLLYDMATEPFNGAGKYYVKIKKKRKYLKCLLCIDRIDGGTQFKLRMYYLGGTEAVFKPMRYVNTL